MTDHRLALAWQHFFEGESALTEEICRQVVTDDPGEAGGWRLLGEACVSRAKYADALSAYERASTLMQLGPEDLNNLGVALIDQGRPGDAEAAYRQSLQLRPDSATTWHNLGVALDRQGQYSDAADAFRQSLELDPDASLAYDGLAGALSKLGRGAELLHLLENVLRNHPERAGAHHALGVVFAARKQWGQAEFHQRRAIEIRPDYAAAACDLGSALTELDRPAEAIDCYNRALALRPGFAEAHNNLGNALSRLGRLDEALTHYDAALCLKPDYPSCSVNRATTLLQLGQYERGWQEYEWRLQDADYGAIIKKPIWDGSPLHGRTLMLVAEQGLGDTIQFIRFAPLLKERCGGKIVLACQKALIPLLESCPGIDRLVAQGEPSPEFDVFLPLMSSPRILGTTLETVPASIPYLKPRPELVAAWERELRPLGRFLVGIAWQGSPQYTQDRLRSFPLASLEPLARLPGVALISLQKGRGTEQLSGLAAEFPVVDLSDRIDRDAGPFVDSAAILKNLDLVVTCDSAILHLASALGVPTWAALTAVPHWVWMLGRQDSPWYPTIRLFRQPSYGDWRSVFDRMASTLAAQLQATPRITAIPVDVAPGELLDKLTILEIKTERIHDSAKLENIRREMELLVSARIRGIPEIEPLEPLVSELKAVNLAIWEVEDDLRECERRREFGPRFIELARSVYRNNDRRAAIKRIINQRLGSEILEEKGYRAYSLAQKHDAA